MSCVEKRIGSAEVKVSGVRPFRVLVSLLLAAKRSWKQFRRSTDEGQVERNVVKSPDGETKKIHGYAPVNGLKMYYEIEGAGDPLVFIPPAFGFAGLKSFPTLAQSHSVITVDLQGNGRTADIPDRPISIEQYAEDVVALLKYLKISKADFLGESYGGDTAAVIAVRYPDLVRRVVTYSATFAPPPNTLDPETTHYDQRPTAETRDVQFQRESYKKVAPDPNYWPKIYDKVGRIQWKGFSKEDLASIKAPFLIVQGEHDFVHLEHSVETVKLIPHAELAVIPNASHFALSKMPEIISPLTETPVRSALDLIESLVVEGIMHGHFDYSLTCELGTNGRRLLIVKAGKSHKFTIEGIDFPR